MKIEETMVLAEQGDVDAQFNLALYYQYGRGVEQNSKKAVEWFVKAAEQGADKAQFLLAECFHSPNTILPFATRRE